MAEKSSSTWDFTKVLSQLSGKQLLVGIVLAVLQILLLAWFGLAQSSQERIVAGVLTTVILLAVLFFSVGRLAATEPPAPPPGLPELKPATTHATTQEIAAPPEGTIAGPDRSYLICKPDGWAIEEMSMAEWVNSSLGLTGPKSAAAPADGDRNVQVFHSTKDISIVLVPGETRINGRTFPTALDPRVQIKLSVIPFDRAQPPLFIERTLANNFLSVVGPIAASLPLQLTALTEGKIPGSGLGAWSAQFEQQLENVIVNGRRGEKIEIFMIFLGIEGEIRDYLLVMNYVLQTLPDSELEREVRTLQSLVSSFRPLKTANPAQKRLEMLKEADKNFEQFTHEKGRQLFSKEFEVLLRRLAGLDLDDPADRLKAIQMVEPFEKFAALVGIQGPDPDAFWDSLHQAQRGDASNFKQQIVQAIASMKPQPVPNLQTSQQSA
jgi:hypothetical protein